MIGVVLPLEVLAGRKRQEKRLSSGFAQTGYNMFPFVSLLIKTYIFIIVTSIFIVNGRNEEIGYFFEATSWVKGRSRSHANCCCLRSRPFVEWISENWARRIISLLYRRVGVGEVLQCVFGLPSRENRYPVCFPLIQLPPSSMMGKQFFWLYAQRICYCAQRWQP